MKNPPPRPAIDPAEQNRAAARTLDDLARAARPVKPIEQKPAPLPTSPSAPLPPLDDSDRPHLSAPPAEEVDLLGKADRDE